MGFIKLEQDWSKRKHIMMQSIITYIPIYPEKYSIFLESNNINIHFYDDGSTSEFAMRLTVNEYIIVYGDSISELLDQVV